MGKIKRAKLPKPKRQPRPSPDRRLHATMTQMVADFDAWHRENPESQWVPG